MSVTSDEEVLRLERQIGVVLRIGIAASTLCLVAGLGLRALKSTAADGFLGVGIVVLIATPAARVALSLVSFLKERDRLFALLTAIVLAELGASVVAALIFHAKL